MSKNQCAVQVTNSRIRAAIHAYHSLLFSANSNLTLVKVFLGKLNRGEAVACTYVHHTSDRPWKGEALYAETKETLPLSSSLVDITYEYHSPTGT